MSVPKKSPYGLPSVVEEESERAASKAGRKPAVSLHPNCAAITKALVLGSMSIPKMADKFGIGQQALINWRKHYIAEEMRREILVAARVQRAEAQATELNGERVEIDFGLRRIVREIELILDAAKGNEDHILALGSLKEMRNCLMDLARIQRMLQQNLTVNVNLNESPQFLQLREIILRVLERHPEAKADFLVEMHRLRVDM